MTQTALIFRPFQPKMTLSSNFRPLAQSVTQIPMVKKLAPLGTFCTLWCEISQSPYIGEFQFFFVLTIQAKPEVSML